MKPRPTRYPELGYACIEPGLWRIVDTASGSCVGPFYRTKAELLADLARYAAAFGCDTAHEAKGGGV